MPQLADVDKRSRPLGGLGKEDRARACPAWHGALGVHGPVTAGNRLGALGTSQAFPGPPSPQYPRVPGGISWPSCMGLYQIPVLTIMFSWRLPSLGGARARLG